MTRSVADQAASRQFELLLPEIVSLIKSLTLCLVWQGELENALLPALLQGNVPGLAAALAGNTSLSPLLNMTHLAPTPAPAQDDISVPSTLPPAMVCCTSTISDTCACGSVMQPVSIALSGCLAPVRPVTLCR